MAAGPLSSKVAAALLPLPLLLGSDAEAQRLKVAGSAGEHDEMIAETADLSDKTSGVAANNRVIKLPQSAFQALTAKVLSNFDKSWVVSALQTSMRCTSAEDNLG